MRLIDADEFKNQTYENCGLITNLIVELIDKQPTIYYPGLILAVLQNELKYAEKEKERAARENPSQFDLANGYALGVEYTIELIKHSLEKKTMNRKTIEEYVETLDQQIINEIKEKVLKELDNFIDKLDEASNYASTIRQLIKNSKNNVEIVETILTFANEIDGILAKINNNFEGL